MSEITTIRVELPGYCDRGCMVCSINYRRVNKPNARGWSQLLESFPMANARTRLFGHIAWAREVAVLKRHVESPEKVRIDWCNQDVLESPLFDDALREAYELGFREMHVLGPGTRLSQPGVADFLYSHGVKFITLTAHGHRPETFDLVAGKAGAHDLFWRALRASREAGLHVSVNVPLIRPVLPELPSLTSSICDADAWPHLYYWHPEPLHTRGYARLAPTMEEVEHALSLTGEAVPARRVHVEGVLSCYRPPLWEDHFIWRRSSHVVSPIEYAVECDRCSERSSCPGAPAAYFKRFPQVRPID